MINEFKAFLMKGNVLDLAVGIIIGVAFTAIVTSLVDDLIQPLIGLIIAWVVFLLVEAANAAMPKKAEAPAAPAGPSDNDLLKEILATLKAK